MKKFKHRFLIVCFVAAGMMTLSSCNPPLWFISTDDSNSAYKDRQQLIFDHLWQRGSTDYPAISALIQEFNDSQIAQDLNVYVKGDGINFWDYWDKVNLSISGGTAPDIYIHAIDSLPTRINYTLDLTQMYDADVAAGRDTLNASDMFYQSQIDDITRADSSGDMMAWPFSATVRVIYYNKTMFDAAGITTLPTDWADLATISQELTTYNTPGDESSGYATVGFDPFTGEGQYINQWGWLAGHDFFTYDSNGHPVPHFNDTDFVDDIDELMNFYPRKTTEARDNLTNFMSQFSLTNQNPFASGKLGMMIGNEGLYATLKQANVDFDYGVFEIPPKEASMESVNWSSSYSIELYDNNNRSGISDEVKAQRNRGAWEFLKFLYGYDGQKVISDAGFMIADKQYYDDFVYTDPILTELSKAIAHAREKEYIAAAPSWTSDIQVYVNNIYNYTSSVQKAMDNAQSLMESKITQYYQVHS